MGETLTAVSRVSVALRFAQTTLASASSRSPKPSSIAPTIPVHSEDAIMACSPFGSEITRLGLTVGGSLSAALTMGFSSGGGSAATIAACWAFIRTLTGLGEFFDQRRESSKVCGSMP